MGYSMKTFSIEDMIPTEFPPIDTKSIINSFNKALIPMGKYNNLVPQSHKHYRQLVVFDQMAKYYTEGAVRYVINDKVLNDNVKYNADLTIPLHIPTKNLVVITKAVTSPFIYEVLIYNDISLGAKSKLAAKLGEKLKAPIDPNLTGILFHYALNVNKNTLISPFVAFEYREGEGFEMPAVFEKYFYDYSHIYAKVSKEETDAYINSIILLFSESLHIINDRNIIIKPMVVSKVKQKLNKSKFTKYGNEYKLVELDQTKVVKQYYSQPGTPSGAHKSPRMHERMGHWRHYKSGKRTWVKRCVVGDPNKGVITKDYNVHPSKSAVNEH